MNVRVAGCFWNSGEERGAMERSGADANKREGATIQNERMALYANESGNRTTP